MVRRLLLLSSALALLTSVGGQVLIAANEGCTQTQIATGTCVTAGIGDDDVSLGIEFHQPGSGGGSSQGGSSGSADPAADSCPIRVQQDRCLGFGPGKSVPGAPTVEPSQPITVTDIARFRPTTGVAMMQPNGWMVVNLDTNFYATGGPQIVAGSLFGNPAMVRFTPVAWHWSYGDGSWGTLTTPGGSWESQGVAEFDATSGSHIYRDAGTFVIDLSIEFTAEYSFGAGGWRPIVGTLTVPANRLVATAGTASTVLVGRECTVDPLGPGC